MNSVPALAVGNFLFSTTYPEQFFGKSLFSNLESFTHFFFNLLFYLWMFSQFHGFIVSDMIMSIKDELKLCGKKRS
jgi:hypothetical protein